MSNFNGWRVIGALFLLMAVLSFASCNATPAAPIAQLDPQVVRVSEALVRMPKVPRGSVSLDRTFFATIRAAGQRTTASGILQYHGPRDFRIAAITELGVLLFDGRMDWAGVHVHRHMDGLTTGMVETLITDLCRAFEMPADLDGLAPVKDKLAVKKKLGDGRTTTWLFDPGTGTLSQIEVDMGLLDTLRIELKGYDAKGWPTELRIVRRARVYEISLSFTDQKV